MTKWSAVAHLGMSGGGWRESGNEDYTRVRFGSAAGRDRQDDKVERRGPLWRGWRWMDGVKQPGLIAWKLRRLFLALHV
jgi:hypothetical protein